MQPHLGTPSRSWSLGRDHDREGPRRFNRSFRPGVSPGFPHRAQLCREEPHTHIAACRWERPDLRRFL